MKEDKWARLLAYVTGLVNQELLLQNEYLMAENRILRDYLPSRLRLSDPQRSTLAEIGKRLGRKALAQVACVAKPDTILAWYRRLVAQKFDGSKYRNYPGRPRIEPKLEALIVQMAKENSGWGYDRIVGALANLGHAVSDQGVGIVLKRHGIAPAPKRSQTTTWKEFIRSHMAVLAGIDFFTAEVVTWHGLVTYYVLFFIHLESRRVSLAGITRHPDQAWMQQIARNATGEEWGFLDQRRYVLHDRDAKFCSVFRATLTAGGIKPIQLPARSPNLNAFAERWVRFSERGMFSEADLVRRRITKACSHRVHRAFSRREEPSGERKRPVVPGHKGRARETGESSALPRAPWRLIEVLRQRCMNILTIRGIIICSTLSTFLGRGSSISEVAPYPLTIQGYPTTIRLTVHTVVAISRCKTKLLIHVRAGFGR
jgi:putative transposase